MERAGAMRWGEASGLGGGTADYYVHYIGDQILWNGNPQKYLKILDRCFTQKYGHEINGNYWMHYHKKIKLF